MTNRRNFVKQAAAVMAMAAMPGVYSRLRKTRERSDIETFPNKGGRSMGC